MRSANLDQEDNSKGLLSRRYTSPHLTKEEHLYETSLDRKDYFFRQKPKCRMQDVGYNVDTQKERSDIFSITLKPQKSTLLTTVHSRLQTKFSVTYIRAFRFHYYFGRQSLTGSGERVILGSWR